MFTEKIMSIGWVSAIPAILPHSLRADRSRRCLRSRVVSRLDVQVVPTVPIAGQKTGTSGLRKQTSVLVEEPKFVCNWIQSLFDCLGDELRGKTLILGGDGRYYNKIAAQTVIRMAAANAVARVIVGKDCVMSTPAVSACIIQRKAFGGIIMTASHNPGGINGDWGVKYNTKSGSPATEVLLDRVYERTLNIDQYRTLDLPSDVDTSSLGETSFDGGNFVVEVISSTDDHANVLRGCFDFNKLKSFIAREDFSLCYDGMNAAGGLCADAVLVGELGAAQATVINSLPLEDFGGGHPDPNLTYAKELLEIMDPSQNPSAPDLGAASDGDGDRNMILGKGFFVTPSDSLAVIADYAERAIPFFKDGVRGLARSMPTSGAVDRVAAARGLNLYETPTGWKYFGNLMDAGMLSICGEESFGIGSNHIREKDGLWAVLAWLSILAYRNEGTPTGELVGVEQIVREHWAKYGRNLYLRYDYENVESEGAESMMDYLTSLEENPPTELPGGFVIKSLDEFSYVDPVDKSKAEKQGIRVLFENGSRLVVRLSGTGSAGATIRIYLEYYETDQDRQSVETTSAMQPLVDVALLLTKVGEFSGRDGPTVIT
ncbi:hypothetical protein NDN08_006821 [Rhodosorus marinus]|uniref:phosphoglucomutase (alpha-D-glucose-1,6-bisphosphate-dependent) n=1 Tax=Rhodosorus marinus TaxID=101924 RepID=A0AAV8ULW0_9RHOD|nr:hypothetical protein NDN08_006821 [Rhodosorus marinus]